MSSGEIGDLIVELGDCHDAGEVPGRPAGQIEDGAPGHAGGDVVGGARDDVGDGGVRRNVDVLNGGDAAILVDDLEDADHLAGDAGGLLHIRAADGAHRLLNGGTDLLLFERRQAPVPLANELQHPSLRAVQHDMKMDLTPLYVAASREKHKILIQKKLASTRCCAGVARTLGIVPDRVKNFIAPDLATNI